MRRFTPWLVSASLALNLVFLLGAASERADRRYLKRAGVTATLPFSDGVLAGDTLYLSGKLGLEPGTRTPAKSVEREVRLALDSMKATLEDAGMTMDDLVSVQVFSPQLELYDQFNKVYRSYFGEHPPARAFVGSGPLLFGARFEIQGNSGPPLSGFLYNRAQGGNTLETVKSPIQPARLKAGLNRDDAAARVPQESSGPRQGGILTGKALIFWDPERPGKKLDAIDTDQITPAVDCVSESLETLDQRWKDGSFRHLMPDFGERVRRGEIFVVAGERFAIGSSREMSPAGLKGVAEDAGLEMVILCGDNMGDIFRRNSLNLGLHVVQSPEAVDDVRDGDELSFDPASRALSNITQGKTYEPLPLSQMEEELRSSGGIFAVGRRDFVDSLGTEPRIEFPDAQTARGMTTTEQIVWAHRVDKDAAVRPGETLRVYADLLPASDGTGPFSIYTFNRITGGDTIDPRRAAFASDHFVFTGNEADDRQTAISREFAAIHGIGAPYFANPGDGIFHFYFPEQGLILPGGFYPGADSHSRAYGAYGAVGLGVGSTTLGYGWATGSVYFTPARQRRVVFEGDLQPWVNGKDIVLELLRRWGSKQSQGMGVEFVDRNLQLPIPYRNTITNMMAEGEAQNGIFAPDRITTAWFKERGIPLPYPALAPGEDATYAVDETLNLAEVEPMVAKPFSPGNAYPAHQVARERIRFDKAMIGSCTNGGYDDLLSAALVLQAAKEAGHAPVEGEREFLVFPGSGRVKQQIEHPEPRLGSESIADLLRSMGAHIRESWCGPCFGQGPDALDSGQSAVTTFNRNWQNRMGVGGLGYLASPQVVAASALLGYIGSPSELGLAWDADRFAV